MRPGSHVYHLGKGFRTVDYQQQALARVAGMVQPEFVGSFRGGQFKEGLKASGWQAPRSSVPDRIGLFESELRCEVDGFPIIEAQGEPPGKMVPAQGDELLQFLVGLLLKPVQIVERTGCLRESDQQFRGMNGEGELHGAGFIHLTEIELNVVMEFLVRPCMGKDRRDEAPEKKTPPACFHGWILTG